MTGSLFLEPERSILEALSRGEISRPEAARCLGRDLSFGAMVLRLSALDLPLPRFPPDERAVALVRDLTLAAKRAPDERRQ